MEPRVIYLGKMEWEGRKSRGQAPQNKAAWPRGGIKVSFPKKSLQTGQGCLGQKGIPAGLVQGSFTNDSQAWE